MSISQASLIAASDGAGGGIQLRAEPELMDVRLRTLAMAVDVERTAGFPNGRLFLDSVEQALAVALVVGYAERDYSVRTYRGGLGPARAREAGRRLNPLRTGGICRTEHRPFLGDVSKVDR